MNIQNLQINLQRAIDNASRTVDYLLLARAVESLRMGQIRTVDTFANLPSAFANEGLLVFVEADERVYFSNGVIWVNLSIPATTQAWAWGTSFLGELGTGTTTTQFDGRSSPVSVVGGFTDWCQVSAGLNRHSVGLRTNGTVWAWGYNRCGQLGNNTTTNSSSPVSVVGGFTDWCQISAGSNFTLAVRQNGTAWAWGDNRNAGNNAVGKLGDNSVTRRSSPVSVVGGFTDWCQVSAGNYQGLGVRTNGTAWAWGCGLDGILGNNSTISRSSPVSVVGGFTDWCQVSAGGRHSLGLRTNGTVWAWGLGSRLGNNQVATSSSSPVSVVGGFTDWCQVSAGNAHNLGVRTNGTLWSWGYNSGDLRGALGDGTTINRSSPVSVLGGFTDWCQVSAGFTHSLGVRTNGTAWSWGRGNYGRLGNNSTIDRSSPVSVVGGFTTWCQVSAGTFHSHAIRFNTN